MQVKTKIEAFISSAVIAGALSLVSLGNGSYQAPSKPTASFSGLSPTVSATFHRAEEVSPAPEPSPSVPKISDEQRLKSLMPPRSLDSYVLEALKGGLVYIVIFILAHLGLRRLQQSGRWTYAGIGSLATSISIAGLTPLWAWERLLQQGRLSFYFLVIAGAGAMMGFIYRWRAGLEGEGDDPSALARALETRSAAKQATVASTNDQGTAPDEALIAAGRSEYFDGPLQVRTTFAVMFVAAIVSSGFYCLMLFVFGSSADLAIKLGVSIPFLPEMANVAGVNLIFTLALSVVTALPSTFLIFLGHLILRGFNKLSYPAYIVSGFLAPVLLSLLVGPLGLIVGLQAALPMAIAMGVYRSMAGLEPKPVKEDIILNDRHNLVGANHARRQFGRLVKS